MLIAGLLSAVTLASFWPVFHNDFIKFDDLDYVTTNPHVATGLTWENVGWAFRSGQAANWHPLTWLSHMLDVQLFGLRPGWHHLTSLLFHTANALLLFMVLRRMTGTEWRSACVAVFFALHPLHVESVAWAAERKDVLSTFFFMLTLWAYVRYTEQGEGRKPQSEGEVTRLGSNFFGRNTALRFHRPFCLFYILSLLFFVLGLMSKPMLVTLPFVLWLLDYWPLRRCDPPNRKTLVPLVCEKIPFVCLAIASSIVTFLVQDKSQAVRSYLPLALRLANVIVSYVKYLGDTLWPAKLAIFYQHPNVRYFAPHHDALHPASDQWPGWEIGAAALLLALISLGALLRLKRQPWFATGWFWYLGTLVPVIGIIQVGAQAMADRYTYIPLIGIFLCFVWGGADFFTGRRSGPAALAVAGGLGVVACALATHRQVKYWRDDLTVFEHALAVTRNNALAHYHVGTELAQAGKYDLAMSHFGAALEADPNFADAYYGQVHTLELLGRPEEAREQCQAVLQLKPWLEWANNRMIALLWKLGRREEAISQCAKALRFNPSSAEAHCKLGIALSERGELAEAAAHLAEAARLKPDYGEAITGLAEVLLKQGRPAEAAARFRESLLLNPTNAEAHINLGGLLWRAGQRAAASEHYSEALRLRPNEPVAHYNMGTVLFAQGKFPEAADQFGEAVRLRPDYTEALTELGRVLVGQGKLEESLARFREAARLGPTNANLQINLGNALMLVGQTNQATACFANALRLEPGLAEKLAQAGKSLAAQGQLNAALTRFRTALYLKPNDPDAHENLGLLLAQQAQSEEAAMHFEQTVRLRPDAQSYYNLGRARLAQGRPREAVFNYEAAVRLRPEWTAALNDLAWIMATHPQANVRDGPAAVILAERACRLSSGKETRFLATLDTAYAEAGRFADAIRTAEKTRELAVSTGDKEGAKYAETRLDLYRKHQPYRQ